MREQGGTFERGAGSQGGGDGGKQRDLIIAQTETLISTPSPPLSCSTNPFFFNLISSFVKACVLPCSFFFLLLDDFCWDFKLKMSPLTFISSFRKRMCILHRCKCLRVLILIGLYLMMLRVLVDGNNDQLN